MDNTPSVKAFPVTDAIEKNTAELAVSLNANDIADAIISEAEEAYTTLGHIEAAHFMLTVSEKMIAESAIKLKKGKLFKNVMITDETGIRRRVSNFEEFCQFKLKKSRQRVEELIRNYNLLGPELYEQAERLGFGQRDYNALKALPADDRAIIAQAIEAEDLDKALDLMQQMAAKHHREKETTSKQLDELTKSVEAKDSVIKGKSEELDKKNEQLARLQMEKTSKVDEVAMLGEYQLSRLQEYARDLTVRVTATLNSEIVKLYNEFGGQPPKHIELAARQAVGLVITSAYGVAENMGFEPITEPELADDEPGKADAEAFMAHQAAQAEA
jgi:hypothetical protein